jgi:hypothetical protein
VTRKGRPTDFLFLLHLILGIPPATLRVEHGFCFCALVRTKGTLLT